MDKLVNSYIKNAKSEGTFYGGKHGYDIVSIKGSIDTGTAEEM